MCTTNIVNIIGNNFGNQQKGMRPGMMQKGGMGAVPFGGDMPPMGDHFEHRGHCPECGRGHGNELAEFGDSDLGSKLGTASIIQAILGNGGISNLFNGGLSSILGGAFSFA